MAKRSGLVFVLAVLVAGFAAEKPRIVEAETVADACSKKTTATTLTAIGLNAGSTILLAKWGGATTALVADEDDVMVRAIDVDTGNLRSATAVGGTPAQMAILGDGRVAVTLRNKNQVQLLEPLPDGKTLSPLCAIDVADEPVGTALTPNGAKLLVTSEYGRALTTLETKTMAKVSVASLPRDPRSVIVDDEGKRAFVSHVVGGKLSIVDLADAKAKEVALDPTKKLSFVTNPIAQKAVQGFALAKSVRIDKPFDVDGPSEPKVFMPLAVADPGEPQVRSSGYGSGRPGPAEVPFVAVIDAKEEKKLVSQINGEDIHRSRECMLPRAARFVSRTKSLLVACMGIDMVVSLDAKAEEPSRKERARWRVGAGPTGIAVDAEEKRAVVWSQFDHALTVIALEEKTAPKRVEVARNRAISPNIALGRVLFHKSDDPRLSRDGRACASCHPDGREDSITWATPSGPRQTIMLAGRTKGSAPFSWSGTNNTIEEHVVGTFQRLGGTGMKGGVNDSDLAALLEYVGSMSTPAARARSEALITRGRDLFFAERQGCSSCHIGGVGTDGKTHDVGAKGEASIDTPSLRFVRGTAPYFHDGRYPSLDALLSATDHRMGSTQHLDANDRRALVAYLETL